MGNYIWRRDVACLDGFYHFIKGNRLKIAFLNFFRLFLCVTATYLIL